MAKRKLHMCPTCGQNIADYKITLHKGVLRELWKVMRWCKEKNRAGFKRNEVKHLTIDTTNFARFGDLKYFGGLIRAERKGHWEINIVACEAFFKGETAIPMHVWKNPVDGRITGVGEMRRVHEMPELWDYLNADGEFIVEYRTPANIFQETLEL